MSRVLYVSQYFVSADQPGGVRHWQRAGPRAGHEVTVVTSYVQHKERTIPEAYRGQADRARGRGRPRRLAHLLDPGLRPRPALASRQLRTFAWWSTVAGARAPRPDVVASSPSLPSAAAAALARARGALPAEVRDLWPGRPSRWA